MATRTSSTRARPAARSSGGGSRTPARSAPRKPASRSGKSRPPARPPILVRLFRALFRAIKGLYLLIASGIGAAIRAIGHVSDIELEQRHRRDGAALGLIGGALVIAASVWWHAGGSATQGVADFCRALVGSGAVLLPVLLVALAVRLVRTPPADSSTRGRLIIGWAALIAGVLGMV